MSIDKIIDKIADFLAGNMVGATTKEIAAQFRGLTRAELDETLVSLMIEGYITATYRPGTTSPETYKLSTSAPSSVAMASACRNTASKSFSSLTGDYF